MEILLSLLVWVGIIWGAIKFFKWLRRPRTSQQIIAIPRPPDPRVINRVKHSCKCYRENLTPGERDVAEVLERELGYKDYFIFNHVTIPRGGVGSCQIDHVVVSRFGIFVIETKDYGGWIWGSESQKEWTQTLRGNQHFRFQNPIVQNAGHVVALQAFMPEFKGHMESIVVFIDRCEFKTDRIHNVVFLSELIPAICKYRGVRLTESGLQYAIGKLAYQCQTNEISPEDHIANIQSYHGIVETKPVAPELPGFPKFPEFETDFQLP